VADSLVLTGLARHHGFMGSGCSLPHEELVAMVRMAQAFEVEAIEYVPAEEQPLRCAKCGGTMKIVALCEVFDYVQSCLSSLCFLGCFSPSGGESLHIISAP
jgi:hypothetical protein